MNSLKPKLRAPAAAEYIGISASTLAKMRVRGEGPTYAKVGRRTVVYDIQDLESWLDLQKRCSTSQDSDH